jgi:hypothetical protein
MSFFGIDNQSHLRQSIETRGIGPYTRRFSLARSSFLLNEIITLFKIWRARERKNVRSDKKSITQNLILRPNKRLTPRLQPCMAWLGLVPFWDRLVPGSRRQIEMSSSGNLFYLHQYLLCSYIQSLYPTYVQ